MAQVSYIFQNKIRLLVYKRNNIFVSAINDIICT